MKIKVLGSVLHATTEIKADTLNFVKEYAPELLTQRDKEGEPVYSLFLAKDGKGSISANGVVINGISEDGFATVQIQVATPDSTKAQVEGAIKTMALDFGKVRAYQTYLNKEAAALEKAHAKAMSDVTFIGTADTAEKA